MTTGEAIQKLIEVCRRQHKALETERSYAGWLRRYCRFVMERRPAGGSVQRVEAFLTQLARQDVSASTQNQAFNALVFFYKDVIEEPLGNVGALRATRPVHLRHAPSVQETAELLRTVEDVGGYPTRLIVRLLYGCGLRLREPLNLRVKDLNFDDSRVFILGAKGGKDRVVALPCAVVQELREQLVYARTIWQRDRVVRLPVEMPNQLAVKFPEYQFAWPWAWVFPSHQPCRHPRTGEIVRYRMHEANVQRAVKVARRNLGIAVTPHELRHAYATHVIERGANIKGVQQAMGHASLETTQGYVHADALKVPSPLEVLSV